MPKGQASYIKDITPMDVASFVTAASRNSLASFCEAVRPEYVAEPFHERICSILESIPEKLAQRKKVRIILSIPPRHGKTETASILFPAWALGKHPSLKFILSCYGAELSETIGMKTRDIINSESYKAIFPGISLRQDQKAKAKWMTNKRGSYTGVGIGTAVTGTGADVIIMDDPHKDRQEAESQTVRDTAWEYYRSTLYSRLEGYGAVIVIMQRWHQDDLVGRLREEEARLSAAKVPHDEWEVINFPAIAEDDEYNPDSTLFRKKGEPLWPSKFPLDVLANIRQTTGVYNWACTPAETPILMADWTQKSISEVRAGDRIMGFKHGTSKTKRSLVATTVRNTFSKIDMVYDLSLESGRKVRCTKDHKWFTGRIEGSESTASYLGRKAYAPAKPGSRLMFVCPVDDEVSIENERKWSYLAGLVDGEGSVGRGVLALHQSPERNSSVFDRMKSLLEELGLSNVEYRWKNPNPKHGECGVFNIHNVFDVYRKLIRIGKAAKSDQMASRLIERSHMFVRGKDKVLSMMPSKKEAVYALETDTGNYVAWGYASSNSQYQQDPILAETQEFRQHMFRSYETASLAGKRLRYYTLVDPAISQKLSADNTVVLTIAKEVDGPNIYRIREDAGHFTPDQTLQLIFAHQADYGSEVAIETVQYQQALKYAVIEEQRKRQTYFTVHEIRSSGNKETRIRGLLPLYGAGVIFHLQGDVEFERELLSFPRGRRDDRIDCMSFLNIVVANTSGGAARQFRPKWKGYGRKA